MSVCLRKKSILDSRHTLSATGFAHSSKGSSSIILLLKSCSSHDDRQAYSKQSESESESSQSELFYPAVSPD